MMKKRWICFVLALVIIVGIIPTNVAAHRVSVENLVVREPSIVPYTQSRADNFLKNYTLTGNGAKDMVAIALAQENRTGSQFGYTEEWCADFVSDCAILASQASAVPQYGGVAGLYDRIINAGGTVTTKSPQAGDICFIDWNGGNSMGHVEIVYQVSGSSVYTIGGNSGSGSTLYTRSVKKHAPLSSKYIVAILRPAYSNQSTSYLNECTYYPCYATVKTPNASKLWNIPCSDATSDDAVNVDMTKAGETLTATALYENTVGNYWYRVEYNGAEYYLYGGNTAEQETLFSDIEITGVELPTEIVVGSYFVVRGKITSKYTLIKYIEGMVYDPGNMYLDCKDQVNGRSYTLAGSDIDKNMTFNTLKEGSYYYLIQATVENYYTEDGTALTNGSSDVVVAYTIFYVVEDQTHDCNKGTYKRCLDAHPHYKEYACSICGKVNTFYDETVSLNTCESCRPGKPVLNVTINDDGVATFTWDITANTTHYNVWLAKKDASGDWESIEQIFYAESGFQRTFGAGEYQAQLLSYSSEMWEPDGSDWVHTFADDFYFSVEGECAHNYISTRVEATCVDYGYTIYTCTLCGDTYTVYEGDYSEWTTSKPSGVAEDLIETKTQYRYADKETTTSYEPSLSGWTQVSGEWKQSGSGSVQYVTSWPGGFLTSHSLYGTYNKSPKSASETNTDKTTINSDKVSGYLYYHWCRGVDQPQGPINRTTKSTKQSGFERFCAFYSTDDPYAKQMDTSDNSVVFANGNCCNDSHWYFFTPVNTQSYTTYRKLFTYERWGSWSDWTDNVYTASASRKVESRTMYRTVIGQLGDHSWNSGVVTTPADCTHDGVKTYTCTHCGETKTAVIPKTGHDYEDGYCTSCGAVDPDYNFVPVVLTVGDITGYPGDTVTVPVSISDNSGFAGFTLAIGWDQKSIQLTNIAKGALLNTSESGAFTKNVSGGTVNWVDPVNITGNGELLLLTFKISEQAQAGAYGVTLALKDDNGANFANENSRPVRAEFVSGSILVQEKNVQIASGYSGALSWNLTEDGVLTFTGDGKMKNYSYKSEMPWYAYREQIRHVVLEEGVTSIGAYAFYGMPQLESIEIPETVTAIGDYAFKNAPLIDNVVLPGELTALGDSAFYACTSLRAIDIPASLWTIKPYTFKNCTALAEVTFHEGNLMKISDGAFYNTALTELVLPDCLTILDTFSFKNCAKLTSIELGSGLTELREAVFYATAIPSIEVPEGITKIGPYVFKNCVKLQTIDLPESLTSVGEASFYACTALKSLELPDNVTKIGNYAFRKCEALRTVNLSEKLQNIGESSFYGCESLYYLAIPDSVSTIQGYAFKGCTELGIVDLGRGVKTLGESAFHTCTGLSEIEIPGSVTKIGDYCFSGSTGIDRITFQGDAPAIGVGAFNKLTATAYYPDGNSTWTAANKLGYGGTITWRAE